MRKRLFNKHFEWLALATGLILIATMNPYSNNGISWCLFELAGFSFCPGEGLGHSIAYFIRGDITNAIQANFAGPAAVFIITGRILYLLHTNLFKAKESK